MFIFVLNPIPMMTSFRTTSAAVALPWWVYVRRLQVQCAHSQDHNIAGSGKRLTADFTEENCDLLWAGSLN